MGLASGDPVVDGHHSISQLLKLAAVRSRIAIANSKAFELDALRYQMWKSAYMKAGNGDEGP